MILYLSLLLCFLCLAVHTAEATIYYLKPSTGLDSNNGTATSTPWKTFTKAKSRTCGGGSSACLAPGDTLRVMGGTYTPTQYKGVTGLLMWTQADSIGTSGSVITITNNPGDTVVFDGVGTESYWIWFRATATPYNGHYIVIDGTNMNLQWTNFKGPTVVFRGDSTSILAHHLALMNVSIHDLLEANGAGLYSWNTHHTIFKNNLVSMTGIGGAVAGTADHGAYISEVTQNMLFEGNTLRKIAGYAVHAYGHANMAVTNNNMIIRKNILNNARNACFIFSGTVHLNNYIYNNTCYNEQVPRADMDSNSASHAFAEVLSKNWNGQRIINNIFSGYWGVATLNVANFSQVTTNLTLDYNIWRNLLDSTHLFRWDTTDTTTTYYNLAGFQGVTAFEDHGLSSSPNFVSPTTGNFVLGAGSAAIDTGRDLTTAVGAGVSSTSLTVADAGFFFDGFGMTTGDTIKIGAAAEVTITAVNYSTNVITLSAARSWSSGDAVNLPFSGVKPDMGALESPVSVPVFTTQPLSAQINTNLANVVVTVQDGAGGTVTSFVSNITLSKQDGPGTVGGTLTQAAVLGVATFTGLQVDAVGTYHLLATGSGLPSVASDAFNGLPVPVVTVVTEPYKMNRTR